MKVTIVGTAYPYRGGLAAFNERLANEFKKEGDEVKIETFTLQYPDFLSRERPSTPRNRLLRVWTSLAPSARSIHSIG